MTLVMIKKKNIVILPILNSHFVRGYYLNRLSCVKQRMSAAPVSAENVEMCILLIFKSVALHRAGSQACFL